MTFPPRLLLLSLLALPGCGPGAARLREEKAALEAELAEVRARAERDALDQHLRQEALRGMAGKAETELMSVRIERDVLARARAELEVQHAVLTARVSMAETRLAEVERRHAGLADGPWDLVTMRNGSRLAGRVRALRNGEIEIQPAEGLTVKGPVTGLASVEFRVPGLTPDKLPRPAAPEPAAAKPADPAAATAAGVPAAPVASAGIVTTAPAAEAPDLPPRLKLDVVKRKNQRTFEARSNYTKTLQVLEMEVTVTNLETARAFSNLSARVTVLANGVADPGDYQVLQVEKHPVALDRFGKCTFSTTPRKLESTRSKSVFLQKGMEFYGVLVDILDPAGKVVASKASPERVEQEVERIRSVKEGAVFRL